MKKLLTAILLLIFLPAPLHAQTVADFDWLAGQWIYLRDDGITVEVNWAPAIGTTMIGSLQQRRGEDLLAFETLKLSETADGITYTFDLYLRDEDFERPRSSYLQLTWLGEQKAQFEGEFFEDGTTIVLTLEKTVDDKLHSHFIFKGENQTFFVRYLAARVPFAPEDMPAE